MDAPRRPDTPSRSLGWDTRVAAGWRLRQIAHMIDQNLREAPGRTLIIILLLVLVWGALYQMLAAVFYHVRTWQLVAVVANQQIFVHFFLALAVMLAFSNAVLAYGYLFGQAEPSHLLSTPLHPRHVIAVKWCEGMALSSWSFLLLGVPLMFAVSTSMDVEWYYYPLFIGHFLGFVIIPGTLGLLVAWAVAMWAPRRPMLLAFWVGGALLVVALVWLWQLTQTGLSTEEWVQILFAQIGAAQSPLIPSSWTALGVVAALERRVEDSIFYLWIVVGNAAFLAWLAVNIIGRNWAVAFNRAQFGRFHPTIRKGWFTAGLSSVLFFYLLRPHRAVLLKDIRAFARDATQWTQMAIMLGLLMLYAMNLRQLPLDLENPRVKGLIAFLNLTTVSLILATFTSRFVYPLLSLESQQLWLLGLVPIRRATLLWVKFAFAFAVTCVSAIAVMGLAVWQLELPVVWTRTHLGLSVATCAGLCGISVGLGARFPVLGQRNPARIASGFGGTLNLIVSMAFVSIVLVGVGFVTWEEMRSSETLPAQISTESWRVIAGLLVFSVVATLAAMHLGTRHFRRLDY